MNPDPAPLAALEDRLRRAGQDVASSLARVDITPGVFSALADRRRPRRRWPAVAAAAALVAGTTTLAVPSARAGVARWLGVADGVVDVRIEPFPGVVPTVPAVPTTAESNTPPRPPGSVLFGDPVGASEATTRTGLVVPAPTVLGPPDAIYVDSSGDRIIAVYSPSLTLPSGPVRGVGAIVEVIRGELDRTQYGKFIGGGDSAETAVGGAPALFIGGGSHPLAYLDEHGDPVVESARLAGPTLLWDRDEVTYRLEADVDLATAVALAESIP